MPTMPDGSLLSHFSSLPDPRIERTRAHPLVNILVITICAVICGADDWVSVVSYGRSKASWLAGFLDMSNGVPSHDTFGRVFSLLDPNELQNCFVNWIKSVAKLTDGEVVAIDGKKLNGSADAPKGHYAIHMVSAWACENRLVLGQLRVDEKSNEMKAVPQLLDLLDLSGCIVTLDAMSTHREIAAAIHAHAADYVLPLKENQPTLRTAVAEYFDYAEQSDSRHRPALHRARTVDNDHGRLEVREYFLTDAIDWLPGVTGKEAWPGLRSIGMVRTKRTIGDKQSSDVRYYLTSLPADVHKFAGAVRNHWCIENQLHWVLDVAFDEDNNRSRTGHSAHNLAIVHHIALNLVKQEKTAKMGVKNKRLTAGWDDAYLAKVLFS